MGVQAVLAVLLLFIATVKAQEGNIEFWRKDVTMTCPEAGTWTIKGGEKVSEGTGNTEVSKKTHTFEYDGKNNGEHSCKYTNSDGDNTYYFYMKGKVCENCFELDATVFGLVILVDIIGTAIVMMIIYKCTKKKSSAGSAHSYKPPSRSGGMVPPTPSRDYEQLNVRTRSQDTYSTVNRTG